MRHFLIRHMLSKILAKCNMAKYAGHMFRFGIVCFVLNNVDSYFIFYIYHNTFEIK